MAFPNKILVPVDFGPSSTAALDRAAELARSVDADIHVLHVYPYPAAAVDLPSSRIATPIEGREWAERELQALKTRCERVVEKTVASELREGDPAAVGDRAP